MSAGRGSGGSQAYRYHLLRAASARYRRDPAALDAAELAAVASRAEEALALERRVLATPEAAAVSISQGQLAEALTEIAARYATPDEMADDLARNGLDEAALTEAVRRELTFDAVLRRIGADQPPVSEEELLGVYEAAPERFTRPERRVARHILITINEDFAENRRPAVRQRLAAVATQLAEQRQDFGELARRHSECPTALEGGRLGALTRGQLYPQLDAVLFALDEGAVSDPVESDLGLHLLLCERIEPARAVGFDEVRDALRARLSERRRRAAQQAWLAALPAAGVSG